MNEDRTTVLEMRAAEQERTIEDLSGQIAAQWTEIERLRKMLDALGQRFVGIEDQMATPHENARPPHW